MTGRSSGLYVGEDPATSEGGPDWLGLVRSRLDQMRGRDAHVTMVRIDSRTLYLVEGQAAAVEGFLARLAIGDAVPAVRAALPRWSSRPGFLMTPILTVEERHWLSPRLKDLARNAQEIQACLIWANMRTRETAFTDFSSPYAGGADVFPPASREAKRQMP